MSMQLRVTCKTGLKQRAAVVYFDRLPGFWASRAWHPYTSTCLCSSGHVIMLSCVCRLVDVTTNTGLTPLHYAAWKGRADILKQLVNAGASSGVCLVGVVSVALAYTANVCHLQSLWCGGCRSWWIMIHMRNCCCLYRRAGWFWGWELLTCTVTSIVTSANMHGNILLWCRGFPGSAQRQ
jgi:hypothetical protein